MNKKIMNNDSFRDKLAILNFEREMSILNDRKNSSLVHEPQKVSVQERNNRAANQKKAEDDLKKILAKDKEFAAEFERLKKQNWLRRLFDF